MNIVAIVDSKSVASPSKGDYFLLQYRRIRHYYKFLNYLQLTIGKDNILIILYLLLLHFISLYPISVNINLFEYYHMHIKISVYIQNVNYNKLEKLFHSNRIIF